ncbi:hypothetical protein D3C81_899170 [compost metagenome]
MTPSRQPVAPKYFEYEYTRMVLCGHMANSETKLSAKVPYTSSVRMIRSGRSLTMPARYSRLASLTRTEGGLLGFTRKNALTLGSRSLSSSLSGYCQPAAGSALIFTSWRLYSFSSGISIYGVKIGMPSAMVSPAFSSPFTRIELNR